MNLTEPFIVASAMVGVISIGALVGFVSITIMDLMHHLHRQ